MRYQTCPIHALTQVTLFLWLHCNVPRPLCGLSVGRTEVEIDGSVEDGKKYLLYIEMVCNPTCNPTWETEKAIDFSCSHSWMCMLSWFLRGCRPTGPLARYFWQTICQHTSCSHTKLCRHALTRHQYPNKSSVMSQYKARASRAFRLDGCPGRPDAYHCFALTSVQAVVPNLHVRQVCCKWLFVWSWQATAIYGARKAETLTCRG